MDHNFFIHSSVNRHLGCFHVLAIVNSAAMNIGIHVSFSILVSSGYMPRRGISGSSVQFSSDTQSCPTLCDPMNCSTPSLPVHHQLPEFTQTHVHRVSDATQHLLLPPIPPSIRVFSNESTLPMRWPKYWSFSFSIGPSKEHPGL